MDQKNYHDEWNSVGAKLEENIVTKNILSMSETFILFVYYIFGRSNSLFSGLLG